jgi:phosphate-selective porin OprO and OprP
MKKILTTSILVPLLLVTNAQAGAQNSSLDSLKDNIKILEEKVANLEKDAKKLKSHGSFTMSPAPKFVSPTGDFSFAVNGEISFDTGVFSSYDSSGKTYDALVRRAQIDFKGDLGKEFGYRLQVDFAPQQHKLKKAYVVYNGIQNTRIYFGKFLSDIFLSSDGTFLEDSAAMSFDPGLNNGLKLNTYGDSWQFTTSLVTATDTNNKNNTGVYGRFTVAPINDKNNLLHLGASGVYSKPKTGYIYSISTNPETNLISIDYISTGDITGLKNISVAGVEFVAIRGPLSFQTEYMQTYLNSVSGPNYKFTGGYGQINYTLTGERRGYDVDKGELLMIEPNEPFALGKGIGAWEVAFRYSNIDLRNANLSSTTAAKMDIYTLGLDWYLNQFFKMSADASRAITKNRLPKNNASIFALRADVIF